ncbi:MAG: hypothetical protein ACOX7F_05325 [Eubacteriales bacterium]
MKKLADQKEIQAFWTSVMRSEEATIAERFKASELLAKNREEEAVDLKLKWFKEDE